MTSVPLSASGSRRLSLLGRVAGRQHLHQLGVGVVPLERRLQVARPRLAGQGVEVQGHAHQHALPVVADRGHEDRPPRQLGKLLQLGQVLVLEAEAIELEGRRRCRPRAPRSCCARRRCSR